MNEQEERLLVRAALARHTGQGGQVIGTPAPASPRPVSGSAAPASHSLYAGLVNVSESCVIEPAVSCDQCGYCKSHGY